MPHVGSTEIPGNRRGRRRGRIDIRTGVRRRSGEDRPDHSQDRPFASTGKQVEAACRLYMRRTATRRAGASSNCSFVTTREPRPRLTKRIAQELVVRDRVNVLAGFGLTPLAFATAPVATETKVPMIVMAAATSAIPQRSPFIVRSGFTLPQVTAPLAEWAPKNSIRKVITLVTDYGPGIDAEKTFVKRFTDGGGDDRRIGAGAARQSRFRAVRAAREGCESRRAVRLRPVGRRVRGDEAIRGTRAARRGHAADLHRRRRRRRHPRVDGRSRRLASSARTITRPRIRPPENKAYVDGFMQANSGMRPNFIRSAATTACT